MNNGKLSVVIPAYNEERYIGSLIQRVLDVDLSPFGLEKEVVVVDDCSTDKTEEIVAGFPDIIRLRHEKNGGKGSAVRTGLKHATGNFVIIQDADLEYDPNDYVQMIEALLRDDGRAAVYGSRYMKYPERGTLVNLLTGKHKRQSWTAYLGGQSLSFAMKVLNGHYISDTVTALKLFRREVIQPLELTTNGFELDHEISAKVLAKGSHIAEVPISYFPRGRSEGKKIGLKDWFKAIRTFYRFRHG